MSLTIPPKHANLLREVIAARRPELSASLDASTKLSSEVREAMRHALAEELAATGLNQDDEPNERGQLIEELIDRLGHL